MALDRAKRDQVRRILGDPDLYPDEMLSWLPKFIMQNVHFVVAQSQLPLTESIKYIDPSAFSAGWVNYGSGYEDAGYFKDPWGIVHVVGLIKSGTVNNVAFTLPGGYRPIKRLMFSGIDGAGVAQRIDVAANGDIIPVAGNNAFFSLSQINFKAFG